MTQSGPARRLCQCDRELASGEVTTADLKNLPRRAKPRDAKTTHFISSGFCLSLRVFDRLLARVAPLPPAGRPAAAGAGALRSRADKWTRRFGVANSELPSRRAKGWGGAGFCRTDLVVCLPGLRHSAPVQTFKKQKMENRILTTQPILASS